MLDMACKASLEEHVQETQDVMESRRKVSALLQRLGLERLDTPADGNCQFVTLSYSAGVPMTHDLLRQQICDYLRTMEHAFRPWIEERFRDYASYVEQMAKDGSYGDDITLQAAAALFLRPIHVVGADGAEGHREFLPPGSISKELWGQPIHIAYVNFKHFEATGPLDAEPPPKRERHGKVKKELR